MAALLPGGGGPPALWDPVVRVVHWAVAAGVLANGVLSEGGSVLHVWIGWIVLGLLALRLVWGFAGPREARFAAFPPSVGGAIGHLRQLAAGRPASHPSHNPAGAMMAYALWAVLAVLIATGIVMTGSGPIGVMEAEAAAASGDWAALAAHRPLFGRDVAEAAEAVHEVAGTLILVLAGLHLLGVAVESRAMRRDLVGAMLFGARRR